MRIQLEASDLEAIRSMLVEELKKHVLSVQETQKFYSRTELCKILGMDKSTYHAHIRQGKLKVKKLGRKVQVVS